MIGIEVRDASQIESGCAWMSQSSVTLASPAKVYTTPT